MGPESAPSSFSSAGLKTIQSWLILRTAWEKFFLSLKPRANPFFFLSAKWKVKKVSGFASQKVELKVYLKMDCFFVCAPSLAEIDSFKFISPRVLNWNGLHQHRRQSTHEAFSSITNVILRLSYVPAQQKNIAPFSFKILNLMVPLAAFCKMASACCDIKSTPFICDLMDWCAVLTESTRPFGESPYRNGTHLPGVCVSVCLYRGRKVKYYLQEVKWTFL